MSTAVATITERVRERIRADGADLRGGSGIAERYVLDEIQRYSERALGGSLPLLADERAAARQVLAALTAYGPLQPFFDDDSIEEKCSLRQPSFCHG
jgi:pilus assembly protein CpaF